MCARGTHRNNIFHMAVSSFNPCQTGTKSDYPLPAVYIEPGQLEHYVQSDQALFLWILVHVLK